MLFQFQYCNALRRNDNNATIAFTQLGKIDQLALFYTRLVKLESKYQKLISVEFNDKDPAAITIWIYRL